MDNPELRERPLEIIRTLETEPTLLAATGHLMAVTTK
jgi:hypothetical protein|tara:strand:- start:4262 stop:4372 length:111 start_codon:yes stop_codon:yes gene_type:complete